MSASFDPRQSVFFAFLAWPRIFENIQEMPPDYGLRVTNAADFQVLTKKVTFDKR